MTGLYVDSIKDESNTKTLATLSSSAVTLHTDVTTPASVGGIWKLLNRTVISGSPTTVEFINGTGGVVIDHATYNRYLVLAHNVGCGTDSRGLGMRMGGGSFHDSADYKWGGFDITSTHTNTGRRSDASDFMTCTLIGHGNGSTETSAMFKIEISLGNNLIPVVHVSTAAFQDTEKSALMGVSGVLNNSSHRGDDIDRFQFFWHGSYTTGTAGSKDAWANTGSVSLYGLKTS